MKLSVTIIIATKNRRDELSKAVQSALNQTYNCEIMVIDDGSTDGTKEFIKGKYPNINFKHFNTSSGYIVRRNNGADIADGEIIFSIDDDAEFSSSDIVEHVIKSFDDPRIGAIAIPYVEPKKDNNLYQSAPDISGLWVTDTFKGTAYAVRKNIFLKLGGFRDYLIHQGEESDFCIRLLDSGLIVRMGHSQPIVHWESPNRDLSRMDYYGARNSILFIWQNVPLLFAPFNLIITTIKCLILTFEPKRFIKRLTGIVSGYAGFFTVKRQPVKYKTFSTWRKLRKEGPVLVENLSLPADASK